MKLETQSLHVICESNCYLAFLVSHFQLSFRLEKAVLEYRPRIYLI